MDVINCLTGWKKLYEPIIRLVIEHDTNEENVNHKIGIDNIKSENGMLKFDFCHPEHLTQKIKLNKTNACVKSLKVCEFCGDETNVGYVYAKHMVTCCNDCQTKFYPNEKWISRNKK